MGTTALAAFDGGLRAVAWRGHGRYDEESAAALRESVQAMADAAGSVRGIRHRTACSTATESARIRRSRPKLRAPAAETGTVGVCEAGGALHIANRDTPGFATRPGGT